MPIEMDHSYIEYFYKAMANEPSESLKANIFHTIKLHEADRDYHKSSLRQINHLIQLDERPNFELKEPRCEIYKISLSFLMKCKLDLN